MAINYEPVGWDTTKYFNPTNMNHMDDGIKAACDNADSNKESIADVNSKLGNTDISAIGDGTLTGGLDALNSNLEKLVIISQSIELENNISSFTLIKSGFSKPPKTMYVLLDALEPNKSGTYVKLYLNNQGDLYTTTESMLSGTWYINGAYISV